MTPVTPVTPDIIRTGTMGWSYEDWRGPFYEARLPASKMLEQYARTFDTVELDTTFYGVPRVSTLDGWAAQTPAGFRFSAKVPRAVTHERRLVNAGEAARDFGDLLRDRLGDKLGALLLQLPPDFSTGERETLQAFIGAVAGERSGPRLPWVVEFRSASWQESGMADWLANEGIACATTERLDLGGPLRYVRLLGVENSVARFDAPQIDRAADLKIWAARLAEARAALSPADPPILVYARNFFEGHAPATLLTLRDLLGLPPVTPPGKEQMSLF